MKRIKALRAMYDYEGTEPKSIYLEKSKETIHSWYVYGFKTVQELEKKFNIVYVYKHLDAKIFVKDRVYNSLSSQDKNNL